jgi:hypothetical protein
MQNSLSILSLTALCSRFWMDKANLINLYLAVMLTKYRPTRSKKVKYISKVLNEFTLHNLVILVRFCWPM